jgi:hypothetical protein
MRWTFTAALLFAACGDSGPGGSGDGGGSSTNPNLTVMTSNGSPATAPVFTTTRPNVESELVLTLENTSSATTGPITLAIGDEVSFTLDGTSTCANAELASGTCTVAIVLTGDTAKSYATDLTITTTMAGNLVLPLSGEVTLPDVSVTPTTYNFGTVPIGTQHTFTVRNNDTVAFNGAISANGPFTVDSDCVLPLAPATSCSLMIGVDGDGAFAGSLTIGLDATNTITVPITGTGT